MSLETELSPRLQIAAQILAGLAVGYHPRTYCAGTRASLIEEALAFADELIAAEAKSAWAAAPDPRTPEPRTPLDDPTW